MAASFVKAQRTKRKLKIGIDGPTGSGKTTLALRIAQYIARKESERAGQEKRIRFSDTENASGALYAGEDFGDGPLDFDHDDIKGSFHPDRYIEALRAMHEDGATGCGIIDSLTHAWTGEDGVLDLKDRAAQSRGVNDWTAWRFANPHHRALMDKVINAPFHLICCIRSKMEHVQEKDEKSGKTIIKKVGLKPEQRDNTEYEFDVYISVDIEHTAHVTKTRIKDLDGKVFRKGGPDLAEILWKWYVGGADAPTDASEQPPAAPARALQEKQPEPQPSQARQNIKAAAETLEAQVLPGDCRHTHLKDGQPSLFCQACGVEQKPEDVADSLMVNAKSSADMERMVLPFIKQYLPRIPKATADVLRQTYTATVEHMKKFGK